jgi:hypothetical protein
VWCFSFDWLLKSGVTRRCWFPPTCQILVTPLLLLISSDMNMCRSNFQCSFRWISSDFSTRKTFEDWLACNEMMYHVSHIWYQKLCCLILYRIHRESGWAWSRDSYISEAAVYHGLTLERSRTLGNYLNRRVLSDVMKNTKRYFSVDPFWDDIYCVHYTAWIWSGVSILQKSKSSLFLNTLYCLYGSLKDTYHWIQVLLGPIF